MGFAPTHLTAPDTPLAIIASGTIKILSTHVQATTTGSENERRKFHLNPIRELCDATKWMVKNASITGDRHIISKWVKHFSAFFYGIEREKM